MGLDYLYSKLCITLGAPMKHAREEKPEPWLQGSRWEKAKRLAVISLVIFHCSVALAWGASRESREFLEPFTSLYSRGLMLHGTWGMFGSPHRIEIIRIFGNDRHGNKVQLAPAGKADSFESYLDARERKLRAKLADKSRRKNYGRLYLKRFCSKKWKSIEMVEQRVKDARNQKTPQRIVKVRCAKR